VEDYQFQNLKVNVGLSDRDFDPSNPSYSYKR
jgi:outer membrane lipoprotein-sorting protein